MLKVPNAQLPLFALTYWHWEIVIKSVESKQEYSAISHSLNIDWNFFFNHVWATRYIVSLSQIRSVNPAFVFTIRLEFPLRCQSYWRQLFFSLRIRHHFPCFCWRLSSWSVSVPPSQKKQREKGVFPPVNTPPSRGTSLYVLRGRRRAMASDNMDDFRSMYDRAELDADVSLWIGFSFIVVVVGELIVEKVWICVENIDYFPGGKLIDYVNLFKGNSLNCWDRTSFV